MKEDSKKTDVKNSKSSDEILKELFSTIETKDERSDSSDSSPSDSDNERSSHSKKVKKSKKDKKKKKKKDKKRKDSSPKRKSKPLSPTPSRSESKTGTFLDEWRTSSSSHSRPEHRGIYFSKSWNICRY